MLALREPDRTTVRRALGAAIGEREAGLLIDAVPDHEPPRPVTIEELERRFHASEQQVLDELRDSEIRLRDRIHDVQLDCRERIDGVRIDLDRHAGGLRRDMVAMGGALLDQLRTTEIRLRQDLDTKLGRHVDGANTNLTHRIDQLDTKLDGVDVRLGRVEQALVTMPSVVTTRLLAFLVPIVLGALALAAGLSD